MLDFVFKQKTAYDMRISDWSSDVCSSDRRAHNALTASRASLSKSREKTGIADYRRRPLSTVQLPSFIEYVKENSEYRCGRTYPHIPVRSAYPSQASNRADRKIGRAACRERVCQYV